MASNPNIPQGTLNRLKASFELQALSQLNVTSPYLGPEGISLAFGAEATQQFPTMTGAVQSPEPYQPCVVTIHLLRTQALSDAWEAQRLSTTILGDCTVRPDATTLRPYPLTNCALQNVRELKMNGQDPAYMITITGYYLINNDLWN